MRSYVKYIVLFVILVLIGFVSVSFYHNSKMEDSSKTKGSTVEEKTEDKEDTSSNNEVKEAETSSQTENTTNNETTTGTTNSSSSTNSNTTTSSSTNSNSGTISSNTSSGTTSTSKGELAQSATASGNVSSSSSSSNQNTTSNNSSTNNVTSSSSSSSTKNNSSSSSSSSNKSNSSTGTIVLEVDSSVYSSDKSSSSSSSNSSSSSSTKNNNSSSSSSSSKNNNSSSSSSTKTDISNATIVEEIEKIEEITDSSSSTKTDISNATVIEEINEVMLDEIISAVKEINTASSIVGEEEEKEEEKEETTLEDGVLKGATGYTAVNSKKYLRAKAYNSSKGIMILKPGVPFRILSTNSTGTWWKVRYQGKVGYVESAYCMINLPDYIPSITYKITNASKSIYMSSGSKLSVTGKKLYDTGKVYNVRLGKNQYIVPVVYSFAQKILKAQTQALKEGYSLKIYDAYRPVSVANEIKTSLDSLYNSNATVRNNINFASNGTGWGKSWFIAQNSSAHSYGVAIDVSLTKKGSTKVLKMPSKVHELSTAAVKYKYGVTGQTTVRKDLYADTMTTAAKKLDRYMVNAGLTNLASEWWHFQDNTAYSRIRAVEANGLDFQPTEIISRKVSS